MSSERWCLDTDKRKTVPGQQCKINLQMCLYVISTQYPKTPLMNYFMSQRAIAFVIVNLAMVWLGSLKNIFAWVFACSACYTTVVKVLALGLGYLTIPEQGPPRKAWLRSFHMCTPSSSFQMPPPWAALKLAELPIIVSISSMPDIRVSPKIPTLSQSYESS